MWNSERKMEMKTLNVNPVSLPPTWAILGNFTGLDEFLHL